MLVETDILLALISSEDRYYSEVARLLDRFLGETKISPYSLTELDLLLGSKEIIVKEVKTFYETLSDLLQYREMGLLPTRPEYRGEAHELRGRYERLGYFDSLHGPLK